METPLQKCVRLVAALENLAAEEAANIRTRDFTALVSIQRRAAPIVEHLAAHGPQVADANLRSRIAAVLARRQESDARLSEEIERTREKLRELDVRQRRVFQVGPAYGPAATLRRRLSAIG